MNTSGAQRPELFFSASSAPLREPTFLFSRRGAEDAEKSASRTEEDLIAQKRKDAKSVLPFSASSRLRAINPPASSFRAFVTSCEKIYSTQSNKDTKQAEKETANG